MRSLILAAAFVAIAAIGVATAQARTCYQSCTPTYGGGYNCTTTCY
jgi:hypothetical protein